MHSHQQNYRLIGIKVKDRCKLALQMLKTMKLFGGTKEIIGKTKNGESVTSLEVADIVLVQCNLINKQYLQKTGVVYTFTHNKLYGYLLNTELSNLVFFSNLVRLSWMKLS